MKIFDILNKSSIIEVDGYLLHNWDLDEDENTLEFSYSDEDGLIFNFTFIEENLKEAVINKNVIAIFDDTGDRIEISCFTLSPVVDSLFELKNESLPS